MKKAKSTQGSVSLLLVIGLVVGAIVVLGVIFWTSSALSNVSQTTQKTVDTTDKQAVLDDPTTVAPDIDAVGSISGDVVYPIEFLSNKDRNKGMIYPSDLKVCALNANTEVSIVCDEGFSTTKQTYKFDVTPGVYLIQATTGQNVAYYDLYVKDNPDNEPLEPCDPATSQPIAVVVTSGQTIEKIHAADFWVGHLGCE